MASEKKKRKLKNSYCVPSTLKNKLPQKCKRLLFYTSSQRQQEKWEIKRKLADDEYVEQLVNAKELKKQLTKAKEIVKDYITIAKGNHATVCGVPEENRTINVLQLNEEAEQFLKESN